ncbi:MAG TPA: DUF2865 domain-containing protein [Roseiarcus sp.]|jgi:hypothetical protein|nr:DUF2865 domain-containing protein [Roseiarcus sp.]
MTNGFGRRTLLAVAAAAGGLLFAGQALAQSAECARLQAAIAAAPRGGGGGAAAAAERQRAELASTNAYARSIGCDNQRFLFFGSDPPPQCGEIRGRIARMQANLADLQARAGGGRGELIARYNAECVNAQRGPGNIFEALFGGGARQAAINPEEIPPDQQQQMIENSIENEKKGAHVSAGSYAVCVRSCDGSFFPVSYSGAGSRSDSLEDVCRSLCPSAEVQLYSFPLGGTIDQAVSSTGERYVDMPNALKFQVGYDPTCSCRRKGESWAQALASAEAKYGHESRDILVTPEKSLELSRPILSKVAADPKAKPGKANAKVVVPAPDAASPQTAVDPSQPNIAASQPGANLSPAGAASPSPGAALDANGADTALSAAAAAVSREASGIAGGVVQSGTAFGKGDGQTVTETGPDGVSRKVRIVAPTL